MEFFKIRRDIPFMKNALVFNVISLVTFLAAVFFLTSMGLTYMISHKPKVSSVMDVPAAAQPVSPPPAGQDKPAENVPAPADSKAKDIPK